MSSRLPESNDPMPANPDAARVRVTEVFFSIQGESRTMGWPTVFVRLTGCPLRCGYCDTAYAFNGGRWMTLDEVLAAVARHTPRFVTVTGGEPLAQRPTTELIRRLCDAGYEVSVETSGAVDIARVDPRASVVMDLKTPSSGEMGRNLYENIALLKPKDQIKFVIADRGDYEWSRVTTTQYDLCARCEVLYSPVQEGLAPHTLAEWILADRLPVRFQLQLHKVLWGTERGR